MAIRTKTTWWGIGPLATATVASTVQRAWSATTIYVPETSSRTFRSAIVEVHWQQTTTTAASITAISAGLTVNATRGTNPVAGTWTNSGEETEGIANFDFTAGVNTYFGAVSQQSFTFDITFTGIATNNVSAYLKLTYDYDDAGATHCKTAVIPLESVITAISTSTTNASIGGTIAGSNQIPILNNLLVENNPVIQDYFLLLYSNENTNGSASAVTMYAGLDGSYTTFGAPDRTLASDCYTMYLLSYKGSVPDTSIVHDLRAYCSVTSHHHLCALLVVTYEFAPGASTAALNSVQIPFTLQDNGGTASADAQVVRVPIDIQEPTTITLVNSGAQLWWGLTGVMTTANYLAVGIGAQTARTFTSNVAAASACGGQTLIQRFDSGGASGAGATLARGQCYVDVKVYCAAARLLSSISGIIYLNYISGVASGTNGIAKHNHTIYKHLQTTSYTVATNYTEVGTTIFAPIADTYYWLQSAGIFAYAHLISTTVTPWISYYLENLANEGTLAVGDGWELCGVWETPNVTETGTYVFVMSKTEAFKRHPSDAKVGARTITTTRKYRYVAHTKATAGLFAMTTYHGITFTAAGTVSDPAGTLVSLIGLTVNIHDATSGELLYSTTTTAGGAYTVPIYDSTRNVFAEVYADSSHLGRSGPYLGA